MAASSNTLYAADGTPILFMTLADAGGDAAFDSLFNELASIDHVHKRIHAGIMFEALAYDAALVTANNLDMLFRTAAGQSAHAQISSVLGGAGLVSLFEAPTTSADGTPLSVINRNRSSATTPNSVAFSGPTVSATGTLIGQWPYPGSSGPGHPATAGDLSSTGEFILKADTDYLIRIANSSGGNIVAQSTILFYEP